MSIKNQNLILESDKNLNDLEKENLENKNVTPKNKILDVPSTSEKNKDIDFQAYEKKLNEIILNSEIRVDSDP